MTDQNLLRDILTGGMSMHKTIDWFYSENHGLIYRMANSHKLSREEASDAYSDAVVAFVRNIREHRFRGESKCRTYFIGIFNNKCIDIIRKKTTNNRMGENLISIDDMKSEPVMTMADEEKGTDFTALLNELSTVCKEVLMDWSDGFSMDEIAERNGLKNAHTARSKRYNCFQQLMELLKKNNMVKLNVNESTNE